MQSKALVAFVIVCMTALVSSSPVPLSPPLDVEARTPEPELVSAVAREPTPEPEPACRWGCY